MTKRSYAIIGTGAVGGFCAFKLQQAGFDVHCLLGHDYHEVKSRGLSLIEQNEICTTPVKAYNTPESMPKCDVIIIALKSTSNDMLQHCIKNLMHKNSLIVVMQNGIGIEQDLAQIIEPQHIIGGSCVFKVTKVAPGIIKHFGFSTIELAQYYVDEICSEISEAAFQIAQDLKCAKIDATPYGHLPTIRWKKLIGNIPTSGLSVILNSTINDLLTTPHSLELIKAVTKECITAAGQCGAQLPDDFYEFRLNIFEAIIKMERHNISMKDDFDAKKPLELTAIYKNPLAIAKKNNVPMPLTEMIYQQLLYLDIKNIK